MRITFRYMAQVRQAAGMNEETIDVEGEAAPATLLSRLTPRHGEAFRRLLFDDQGKVQAALLFFVDDEQVRPTTSMVFRDGAVVTVMAPMAGGCGL